MIETPDEKPICHFNLTRPRIGFTSLNVGQTTLRGVSYINPYLLFDLRDFVRDVTVGNPSALDIDCESYGMAHIEFTPSGDLIVTRNDGSMLDWNLYADPAVMATELADSIEENLQDWSEWKDDDDLNSKEAVDEVKGIVKDLRTYADFAKDKTLGPTELAEAFLDVPVKSLVESDIWRLYADLMDMVPKANKTGAQLSWSVTPPDFRLSDDGTLNYMKIHVDGSYFTDRQLAFMRYDNHIGLAGWADSKNHHYIQRTFAKWATDTSRRHAFDDEA